MKSQPARDRVHDYEFLIRRWKRVARQARLQMEVFAKADGMEIYVLRSAVSKVAQRSLYVSAGIHGDEAGATEGLLEWAESATAFLSQTNVLLFPCLNPWGLQWNCRRDLRGRDLNRLYHSRTEPRIKAQKRLVQSHGPFDVAMAMHEDYDARGVYLYEIRSAPPFLGEQILSAAAKHIPLETRRVVEGSRCKNGLIRRKISPEMMPEHPEAFFLHFGHSRRTFTLETPSEFSIHDRVEAQKAALNVLMKFMQRP
jgi:hypothetical protein